MKSYTLSYGFHCISDEFVNALIGFIGFTMNLISFPMGLVKVPIDFIGCLIGFVGCPIDFTGFPVGLTTSPMNCAGFRLSLMCFPVFWGYYYGLPLVFL